MSNRYVFPPEEGPLEPSWREPLSMVHRALQCATPVPSDLFFDLADFMIMCRIVRTRRPDIVLYKHEFTRRYINVDDGGHAYRYFPPRTDVPGRYGMYRAHLDPRSAVANLGLWELPWMKSELEPHRRGLSWEDRRLAFDYTTRDLIPFDQPVRRPPAFW